MVRVNWTFQAKDDLENIFNYISRDSKQYAKLHVHRIKNRTSILKSQTQIGHIVKETNNKNIRELIEGRYRIIYKVVSENQIDILTIHHSARDISKRTIK